MTRTTKSALVVGAGILGVTLGLFVSLSPSRQPEVVPPPPFRFIGTPSVSTGFMTFQITNEGRAGIYYVASSPQVKSNEQWSDLQGTSARATILAPHGTGTIAATTPSNGLPWRVPVYVHRVPTKLELWKRRMETLLNRQNRGGGIKVHVAYSPELTP
jgi:hypothetical protein